MHGKYARNHWLPRELRGGDATVKLLNQIDSPDAAVYVMEEAIETDTDPLITGWLASLIRSGKTQMASAAVKTRKY